MEIANKIEYDDTLLPQGSDLWLETRRKYGTASEAAAAMGVSPWIPKKTKLVSHFKIQCNQCLNLAA